MLSFSNVTKQFSSVKAVDGLSFEVRAGEIFALLGPNGAGKTTSVRMIMQMMNPDVGSITFDPGLMDHGRVDRSKLGYLPEERGLYQDAEILKTLVYLAGIRGMDEKDAAKKAGEWLERFGLADRQKEKITTLSKGNQQKVQFIASILHAPKFAVLDEPFSGFDPINQEMISDCIRELRESGMTILLSAHQMQLVERIADRILLINLGKELICGTMDEIRKSTVSDQKLLVTYQGPWDSAILEHSAAIKNTVTGEEGSLEVFLNENMSMNDALESLSKAGSIKNLKTADVNLHEIFIQSFKKNGGPAS